MPRPIVAALTLVTVLYVTLQLTAQGVLGINLAQTDAPLIAVARALWGPWGAGFMTAATALSVIGFLSGDILCSPRILYALAERGQLSGRLSIVHGRYHTPAFAIAVYTIICATLAVSGSFRQLVLIASSGTLLVYLLCCLGVLYRDRDRAISCTGRALRPTCRVGHHRGSAVVLGVEGAGRGGSS